GPGRLAACLGVWLTGGCVLPLDPDEPTPWLARQRSALHAPVVVSDSTGELGGRVLRWADLGDAEAPTAPGAPWDPGVAAGADGVTAAYLPDDEWAALLDAGWSAPPGFRAICAHPPAKPLTDRLLTAGARVLFLLGLSDGGGWFATGEVTRPDEPVRGVPLPN